MEGGLDGFLEAGSATLSCPESVNVGTLSSSVVAVAFGVVSGSVVGLRTDGGGGGIAALAGPTLSPF